jgi:hypothetical protein
MNRRPKTSEGAELDQYIARLYEKERIEREERAHQLASEQARIKWLADQEAEEERRNNTAGMKLLRVIMWMFFWRAIFRSGRR